MNEDLATLSHEELIQVSCLVCKLLKWDNLMTWDEALRQAYRQVVEESEWRKGQAMQKTLSGCCDCRS